MNRFFLIFFMVASGIAACSQKVNVKGRVVRISGNQMPSPDLGSTESKGFKTIVYFFEPFAADNVNRINGFYQGIASKELARVNSDAEGFFKVNLLPGKYSVLIGKDSVNFYSNVLDGRGVVNLYEFKKRAQYNITLRADWDAAY